MAELDLRHDQLQLFACVWFEDHLVICPPDRCRLQNWYFRLNRSVVWLVLDCLLWLDLVGWLVLFRLTSHVAFDI